MNKVQRYPFVLIFISLLSLYIQPVLAEEQTSNDNTYLQVARNQLSIAFDQYNDGDISASKQSLRKSSDWLNKAVIHSKSDKVKTESEKLASEIDNFRLTLSDFSKQTDIARFWHQTTSLIIRESEHLVHSYIESSNDNTTLKHLLDSKSHFFLAEHDLFISDDLNDAVQELNHSLIYLDQAYEIARPELEPHIDKLINNIKALRSLTKSSKDSWKENKLIDSLNKATNNVKNAESIASPPTRLRLELIRKDIHQLKLDTQKTNLKTKYNSILTDFTLLIKSI